jgi:hypothetical protein
MFRHCLVFIENVGLYTYLISWVAPTIAIRLILVGVFHRQTIDFFSFENVYIAKCISSVVHFTF